MLFFAFLIAFFSLLFLHYKLFFFAPFLMLIAYRKTRLQSLWYALLCGALMDFFTSSFVFGVFSINFCLTMLLLYPLTRLIFEDKITTLPLMTFLFSSLSTLIHPFLCSFFEQKIPISRSWFFSDVVVMPFFDALYAFLFFVLPFQLSRKLRKIRIFKRN